MMMKCSQCGGGMEPGRAQCPWCLSWLGPVPVEQHFHAPYTGTGFGVGWTDPRSLFALSDIYNAQTQTRGGVPVEVLDDLLEHKGTRSTAHETVELPGEHVTDPLAGPAWLIGLVGFTCLLIRIASYW